MTRSVIALAVVALAGAVAAGQTPPPPRWTRVTFLSGSQVYVAAGRDSGLVEGSTLDVIRGDTTAAVLRVVFLSSTQAACEVVRGASDVSPGDRVRYTAVPLAPVAARGDSTPVPRARPPRSRAGPHGRITARYTTSQLSGAGELSQPTLDARLLGTRIGGSRLGAVVDLRARSARSQVAGNPTATTSKTDVYQLALLWNAPGAPWYAAFGRQYVSALSSIVLLDGVISEWSGRRGTFGLFGGVEPAPNLALSTTVQTGGAYFQLRGARRGARATTWAVTTGAAGSYQHANANREFGFLRLTVAGPLLSLHAAQEIDLYRSARRAAGEAPVSLTSSYVRAALHPAGGWSVDAGYDNRRNVRLYRDVTDPLTTFDDRYRQGMWGGLGLVRGRMRARLEARTTSGGSAGSATAFSASAGATRLGPGGLELWGRSTRYGSGQLDGWLHALRLAADPLAAVHVELSGGVRRERNPPVALGERHTTWLGLETDVAIGRAWYMMLNGSRESGPDGQLDLGTFSLSWRF